MWPFEVVYQGREMRKLNVLLICGGGASEHEISLQSAQYILEKLKLIPEVTPHYLCIENNGDRTNLLGQKCELRKAGEIYNRETDETVKLDYAIPCIHGPPGENGQLQSVFELMGLKFLGAGSEASLNCFNKVTTKLWLNSAGIENAPFVYLIDPSEREVRKAQDFIKSSTDNHVFIKAASQGSSIGCYQCKDIENAESLIKEAFKHSDYVLVEKAIAGRELEVAVFEYNDEVRASFPGEIECSEAFYSYEEKYNKNSTTRTKARASELEPSVVDKIKEIAINAFKTLKIKDLARVDFFLSANGKVYVNEINTFPGHTDISMFPQMLESTNLKYEEFLKNRIFKN
jgi:D-alanine-D-alanine ligase